MKFFVIKVKKICGRERSGIYGKKGKESRGIVKVLR